MVVLWILALLAMIAANVTVEARTSVRLASNIQSRAIVEMAADAGVERAVLALTTPRRADQGSASGDMDALAPWTKATWPVDGTPVAFAFDDVSVRVAVSDEGGKIDVNVGRDDLLQGVFEAAGLAPDEAGAMVDAVRDYGDGDDARRLNGAETADYRAANLPAPKNARFEAVQELLHVYGMTPDLYRAVKPALTVYSGLPNIDPWVAPAAVLLALPGHDAETVARLVAARADDPAAIANLSELGRLVGRSRGRVFQIDAEAVSDDGARFVRRAVVRLGGPRAQPYRILRWESVPSDVGAEQSETDLPS